MSHSWITPSTASNTGSGRCSISAELHDHPILFTHAKTRTQSSPPPAWIGAAPLWADMAPAGIWADALACPLTGKRSDLEHLLACAPLDDTALLDRARAGIAWWQSSQICKYSAQSEHNPKINVPYVLVLDQPKSDESFENGSDTDALLREMLVFAQTELTRTHVVILSVEGGHFTDAETSETITVVPHTANPWPLLECATRVYSHSASLGFEAILSGHHPRVFGQPWYAGWGLTDDENPVPHRARALTRAQLFAASMILYPTWINPRTGAPCDFEAAIAHAQARHRAAREDTHGYVASGLVRWKHKHMRRTFGRARFEITNDPQKIALARDNGARHMAWGAHQTADIRVEDGFLRSKGLGAALIAPVSLTLDENGVYFDPTRPSQLENLITQRADLPEFARRRIRAFLTRLNTARLTKYNTRTTHVKLPQGEKILVVGQVEDDASIKLGAGEITTNRDLLRAARTAHPTAYIVFKPHPDVEAGLRKGDLAEIRDLCNLIAHNADPISLIEACDRVWTMTSLLGFEALLRATPVTCTGTPFYAGWGLTDDRGGVPARRAARPSLEGLAHAVLIDFPRYSDPATGAPISPEDAVDLLSAQKQGRSAIAQFALARLIQLRNRFVK
ncbi:capsular polysaccharide biosynthesis protein [Celeribacter marinus]|uniref:capsular polysaccharide biosynthesis protein n=1 Tax=Celeribacter marinus TaxID=1397108 RepID=UPI003F6BDCF1